MRNISPSFAAGEDVHVLLTVYETKDEDSPVQDITGWNIALSISRRTNSTDKLIDSLAMTPVNAAEGTCECTIPASETEDADPAIYFMDVWRVDEGSKKQLCAGPCKIRSSARVPVAE